MIGVDKMRIADLCCCEGGATAGYQSAGFHVTGVDVVKYPNYPGDEFVLSDAIEWLVSHQGDYDAYVGSPPCHKHSRLNSYNKKDYVDLISEMRDCFEWLGKPYVIENVPGAPLVNPVTLCGTMFGLKMYRHRLFETGGGFAFSAPRHPTHRDLCTRNGYIPTDDKPFMSIHGGKHSKAWRVRAAEELGIPWATSVRAVCEAIPPAYTKYIGIELIDHMVTQERF